MIVAGSALPALDQEAAAADAIGCSAHATSFATEAISNGADFRVGCAGDAGALREFATSDNDILALVDFDTTPDPPLLSQMQEVVDTTRADQANGLSLSDSFDMRQEQTGVPDLTPQSIDIDFDGNIHILGSSILIVIPTAEFGTTGAWSDWWNSFWPKLVVGLSALALTVVFSAICLAAWTTGPGAIVACGAIAGGLAGGFSEMISIKLDNKPLDWAAFGAITGTAIAGAIAGGVTGALIKFVEGSISTLLLEGQASLKRLAVRFFRWKNPIQAVADIANGEYGQLILRRLIELQRAVGGTSLPSGGQLRVMVVGDSMTQGGEGDWTWRYRLWQWFINQGVDVNFVGPYTGTKDPGVGTPPSPPLLQGEVAASSGEVLAGGAYAERSESFDSDHFSVWGRQAAQDKNLIREQVAWYQPDLLLVGLGFNDMGWFVSDADGTIASMKTLVDQARAAKPDIDIALANVPQRTAIGGREDLPIKTATYNDILEHEIPLWDTAVSPVWLVDWAGNYSCGVDSCPAGYDGLHPNALGEYQIAHAFELALHRRWGIGGSVPDVPAAVPARPTPTPSNVQAVTASFGVTVTWDKVFGARGYTVRSRVVGQDWTESSVGVNRFDTTLTFDGWQWEYQVRTNNASDGQSDWSPVVTAVAHPTTAPPPTGIVTHATATGMDVAWGAPTGPYTDTIDRYEIIIWDKDIPGSWITGTSVKGLSVHIDGLDIGHRYQVWVKTWNAGGGGLPGGARPVRIGSGTPEVPTGLDVTSIDGTTVQLNWNASRGAAGYRIWVRNINDGSVSTADENVTMDTSHGVAYLFPGVWNYEFCVTATNGAAESGKSNCVVAPRPPGF